ncbi:MAG: T9SS type A sorting domain-containing protein [Chitinophagaceae bacterium]|nr:MAG: T9SS type A sorting domain-containing protein [Chitinophagaceae bacterium]
MRPTATRVSSFRSGLKAFALLGCLLSSLSPKAQLVSFPGAEGAGRFASGGRGTAATATTVFEVTNLNDDNNPGSLRYALQVSAATAPYRTIVFRVGGTIHLNSGLTIRANTTIAGQTAPGGGICIADQPVTIGGNNIILRHLRFRLGDKNQAAVNGSDDALGTNGNGYKNLLIDHCSVSWSNDEALSVYSGDSTTIQWNIISEPLNMSYHNEGSGVESHGYGGIMGGRKVSIHHNIFAHAYSRTPRFDGVRNLSNTVGNENVDFVNNVLYNWGNNNVYGGEGGNYNLVNNYYKYGPSTSSSVKFRVVNPYKQSSPSIPYGKFYLSGNYVDGSATNTANNWRGVTMDGGSASDTSLAKVTTAFNIAPVTTQDATTAYNLVLLNAGATFPLRDTLDQRIINDIRNRTGRIIDVQGGYPRNTPYASTVNAWPNLATGTAPADSDHDGMPDSWETANSLNPANAADRAGIAANGYTNLENYLNSITTTPSFSVNGNLGGFAQTVGSPSAFKTYSVTGTNLTGDVTVTAPASFQVSSNSTTWASNLTLPVVSGNITSTVYVRMNAGAAGAFSGDISNTTSSLTQTISANGIAATAPAGVDVTVAKDGSGNYATVQAAIDAAPTARTTPYVIFIKNGRYREKITIPSNKPFIQLVGESVANTVLYYDDPATVLGTSGSASVTVNATDFSALNITFANTYGDGSQGVALMVNADRAAFKNCRFLGNQDTLYLKGAGTPKAYFRNCYIDGNIDFIFGSAIALFDSCVVYPKTRSVSGNSFITAANTPAGQSYGLVFRNSIIANNIGGTTYYLGRPWQNNSATTPLPFNRTTFLNTTMGYTIAPEGWVTWDATTNTTSIDYAEFGSKDFQGAVVNTASRVPWSQQLSAAQAAGYTNAALFGSWDPCALHVNMCTPAARDIAVSNFRATKGQAAAALSWNISWNMPGITYELYRSTARNGGYSLLNSVTSVNDTAYNFGYTDDLPSSGTAYYYYVVASRAGMAAHTTDTVSISNVQTINVAGALNAFSQNVGTPSAAQTITVSGGNLTDDLTITPPANYEVSADGASWFTATNPLVLPQVAGAVAATPVSVRLNSPSLGTWAGDLVLSSPGATSVSVPVTGTTAIVAPVAQTVLQWWPMTQNNTDSANVRNIGVAPSTTRFNRLAPANGTVAVAPPYSAQRGQALSPLVGATPPVPPATDGNWSSGAGGPGGSLNRTFYEQFVVKANANYELRVDSVILNAAFYNSSSSTRMGIVYSKTGFTTADSANVSTNPGGFTNFIVLNNQTAGPTDVYRLAFNGTTGVSIAPGDSLTFRIYFSCSSSSTGRYALLKDVIVKGTSRDVTIPDPVITATPATLPAFSQNLGLPSASQTYTLSGTNLASPLLVLAPANYEVSLNGTTWSNSVTPLVLNPVAGTVPATTIYVRQNASANGAYTGTIQNKVASGTNVDVTVSGNTSSTPVLVATGTLATFSQTLGTPSAAQTYTLSGINLTGDVTVTPPANYEVSADGGTTWFSNASPLLLTPSGSSLASTTISVRLNAASSGNYGGNIVHISNGAAAVNLTVNGVTSGTPTLTQTGTLTPFAQTVGTPSAVQTYTLAGSALSGTVTVTAPAGYEVSADGGATWFNNGSPLLLTPVAGSLANTTISVRLNAATPGTYAGDITQASAGASTVNVPVTGVSVPAPALTVTAALAPFAQIVGAPSAVQTYTLSGANLVSPVTITPPANYELSANGGTTWFTNSSPLLLTPVSGSIASTTISVRLNATAAGTFNGNIIHMGTGFTTVNVPVTGTAVLPPTVTVTATTLPQFAQTVGTPSAAQQYNVSGQNLTANIVVAAPAGYELSQDGTTWSTAAVTLVPTSGALPATTVYVRLNAAAPGAYNGSITHTSTGAATRSVAVSGIAVAPPSLTATGTMAPFHQVLPDPSAAQSYVLSGVGLLGNITITPPANYQVSLDSGNTWSFVPVVYTPAGGVINLAVQVRLYSAFTGSYSGNVTHVTNGVTTVNVPVTGIATAAGRYSIYPVPAYNVVYFAHPVTDKQGSISIYNMAGQRLATYAAKTGSVETPIRIELMAQGLYLAVYENGSERVTQRFIKK